MSSDKAVAAEFVVLSIVGVLTVITALIAALIPGSPYSFLGHPPAIYMPLFFGAGLMLITSGFTGAAMCQVIESEIKNAQVIGIMAMHIIVFVLFVACVWISYEHVLFRDVKAASPNLELPSPMVVNYFGVILVALALFAWVCTARYIILAHRSLRSGAKAYG